MLTSTHLTTILLILSIHKKDNLRQHSANTYEKTQPQNLFNIFLIHHYPMILRF